MKQYQLFPMDERFGKIDMIVNQCDCGEIKIAVGKIYCYDCGRTVSWDSILCLSREEAQSLKFKWEYSQDHFLMSAPFTWVDFENWDEICEKHNVSLLRDHPEGYSCRILYINNMYKINYEKQFVNHPKVIGEWTSDYGGHGSRIYDPFELKEQSLQTLGFLAEGSLSGNEEWHMNQYVSNMYLKKYMEKYDLIGKTVVHAEGNYTGRPGCRSWNTGIGEIKETLISGVESLKEFAYLGFRCLEIKNK